jgi:hypothetical protein
MELNRTDMHLGHILVRCADGIIGATAALVKKRYAMVVMPFFAAVLSLFFAFPSYDVASKPEMAHSWDAVLLQSHNVLNAVEYDPASHAANIAFRFTPTLLGGLLGIHTLKAFLVFQGVALIILFVLIGRLFQRLVTDNVVACLLTLATAFVFIGNVLCSDYRGFFDVFAFLFLVAGMLAGPSILTFLFLLLAYFTDERALIASSLVYLLFVFANLRDLTDLKFKHLFFFNKQMVAVLASWVVYFGIRSYLSHVFGFRTNATGLTDYLALTQGRQINLAPFAMWTGLEGFWILVIVALFVLVYARKYSFAFLYILGMGVIIFVAVCVFDMTRSMAYLLPAIFASLVVLQKTQTERTLRYIALGVLVVCLFPTYYAGGTSDISVFYPMPMQVFRMMR